MYQEENGLQNIRMMGGNLYVHTTSDTLRRLFIPGNSPLVQDPLWKMVLRGSEYVRTSVRSMEDMETKKPLCICEIYTNEEKEQQFVRNSTES
jgi:hypothetical protein